MNQLLDTNMTPHINSWLDWKFYLPWVPAALFLPVIINLLRQHSRINHLTQLITVMSSVTRSHAFELRRRPTTLASTMFLNTPATTSDISTWLVQQLVSEITSVDTVMFTILMLLIIGTIIVGTVMWRYAINRHSYIYLEIYSPLDCVQLLICKLPNPSRTFALTHSKITLKLRQLGCIAFISIRGKIQIINTLTKQSIKIPTTLMLTPKKAVRIAAILNHPEKQLTFLACHSHEIMSLRQAPDGRKTRTQSHDEEFV